MDLQTGAIKDLLSANGSQPFNELLKQVNEQSAAPVSRSEFQTLIENLAGDGVLQKKRGKYGDIITLV